jgi:hypothetical protein
MRRSVGAIPLVSLILNLFSHPAASKFFLDRSYHKIDLAWTKKNMAGTVQNTGSSHGVSVGSVTERRRSNCLTVSRRRWFANVNENYETARCITSKSRILIATSRCGNWNGKLRDENLFFFLVTSLHCRERIYCRRPPSPRPPPVWRGEKLLRWKSVRR